MSSYILKFTSKPIVVVLTGSPSKIYSRLPYYVTDCLRLPDLTSILKSPNDRMGGELIILCVKIRLSFYVIFFFFS